MNLRKLSTGLLSTISDGAFRNGYVSFFRQSHNLPLYEGLKDLQLIGWQLERPDYAHDHRKHIATVH